MNKTKLTHRFAKGLHLFFIAALLTALTVGTAAADGPKVYWTDNRADNIQGANLDGTGVEDLVTAGILYPHGIALDVVGGKMYWTDHGIGKIQRANLDGTGVEDLVSGLGGTRYGPRGIALDVAGGKMYWTDNAVPKIQRANLDGAGLEDLVD